MALAQLCGLEDFDTFKKRDILDDDVQNYSHNFINNFDLAMPPFSNVSTNLQVY